LGRDGDWRKDDEKSRRGDDDWVRLRWKGIIGGPYAVDGNALRVEPGTPEPTSRSRFRAPGSSDTTPPTIGAAASRGEPAGWNPDDVQVTFVCSDAGSGIASFPPSRLVNTEGRGQVVTGTAAAGRQHRDGERHAQHRQDSADDSRIDSQRRTSSGG
jgi:hypothetical protein